MLAYEIARQLRQSGEEVALLALLDVVLPTARAGFGARSFRRAVRQAGARMPHYARRVAAYVKRRLSSAPPPPVSAPHPSESSEPKASFDVEALRESRQALYRRAMDAYAADMPSYDGDALLVRARAQVERMPGCAADYGWSRHVMRSLSCVDVPGDHLGILAEPYVQRLAAVLRAFL
jgi:thioesterase domain-containing protein